MTDMTDKEFMEKMRKHLQSVESKVKPKDNNYVTYEVFHAANDITLENMRELYSMIHDLTMEKLFTVDFKIGDINIILSSSSGDKDSLIQTAEKMITDLLTRIERVQKIPDLRKDEQRKKDETDKAFC